MKKLFLLPLCVLFSFQLTFSQDTTWKVYTPQNSGLPDLGLYEIAIDKDDIIWILAYSTLIKFDWTNWQVFDSSNSILPNEWGGTISKGGDGNVWIGGYSFYDNIGLVNVSLTPWVIYDTLNSLLVYNQIAGLSPSRDGGIWINSWPGYLTYQGTVQKLTGGNWFNSTQQTLTYIDEMEEDLTGNLWYINVFPSGGVFKIATDTTVWYNFLDGGATCLETDLNGNVWMGWSRITPESSGLLKYDGVNWVIYDQNNSNLPAYWVSNLIVDSLGNLWMSGDGLIKFDGMDFVHYTPQNSGLYSTYIRDIQIDDSNNKWVIHPDAISVFNEDGVTFVGVKNEVLSNFTLLQNFPNPFNPTTTINYQIPDLSFVTLKVFDVLGSEVATLVNEEKPVGTYEITWYADKLPSGIYYYRIKAGSFVETKKMVLMK